MSKPIVRRTNHVFAFRSRFLMRSGWLMLDDYRLWKLSPDAFAKLLHAQRQLPILLSIGPDTVGRPARPAHVWAFKDAVWAAESDLDASAVKGLLLADQMRRAQHIDGAKSLAATEGVDRSTAHRERVPDTVRQAVFERDRGRCVRCGSSYPIEYDHIIPVSMGGSNSVANIQLLCMKCNRSKYSRVTNG